MFELLFRMLYRVVGRIMVVDVSVMREYVVWVVFVEKFCLIVFLLVLCMLVRFLRKKYMFRISKRFERIEFSMEVWMIFIWLVFKVMILICLDVSMSWLDE